MPKENHYQAEFMPKVKAPDGTKFINLGKQANHFDPHIRPGDKLAIFDTHFDLTFPGKVAQTIVPTPAGEKKCYDIDTHNMYDQHFSLDAGSTTNKAYNHSKHTISEIKDDLEKNTQFRINLNRSHIKENNARRKYLDYPYKCVGTLSKNPTGVYEINVGEIVDPDLAKALGTKHVYYEKAIRDFTPNAGTNGSHTNTAVMVVTKGSVSGPIVPSKNPKLAQIQRQNLVKVAKNPDLQDFWLDDNSSLSGSWNMPRQVVMRNSNVHFSTPQNQMTNSWLNDSQIRTRGNSKVALTNANLNYSDIDLRKNPQNQPVEVSYDNSTLSGTRVLANQGLHDIYNSYVENAHLGHDIALRDTSLVNLGSTDNPSEFENIRANGINEVSSRPAHGFDKIIEKESDILPPDNHPITLAKPKHELNKPSKQKEDDGPEL